MKKTLRILASGLLFAGILASPGLAADGDVMVYEPLPQGDQAQPTTEQGGSETLSDAPAIPADSEIPQAVIDYRNKRMEARARRDQLLQERAATIEALSQEGNSN